MSLVESIESFAKPWADFYAHSKTTSALVTWSHITSLVVGGGLAIAADRLVLRLGAAGVEHRRALLADFRTVHRPIIIALAFAVLSGVALTLSDAGTFLVSAKFYLKMGLVVLLLVNGYAVMRTEQMLHRNPAPANALWKRMRLGAIASISLWMTTSLVGVFMMND